MILEWDTKEYNGKYSEAFAIIDDDNIVGYINLYQHTSQVISAGMSTDVKYRRRGYGEIGLRLALDHGIKLGYKIAVAQVRKDNYASIALHKKLGYEIDFDFVKNGNEYHYFIKALY